jgi:predicted CoA-binding protein
MNIGGAFMNLMEMMECKSFAVVGNTITEGKYAKKIKDNLLHYGYDVYPVYKEIKDINTIEEDIDIIDLCINPVLGLEILKGCRKDYKGVLIQPGAESDDIKEYLTSINKPYLEGCALVGIARFHGPLIEE